MADVSIASDVSGSLNTIVSGSLTTDLQGIPNSYTNNISVEKLPKIEIGIVPKENTVAIEGIPDTYTNKISVEKLPKIEIGIVDPIVTNISITEIPSVRIHLPTNYMFSLSFFGLEIAALRLCGEGQVITEPYKPNQCETCGPITRIIKPDEKSAN
jgi:hypothetical protein